jgi:hypothetical protein
MRKYSNAWYCGDETMRKYSNAWYCGAVFAVLAIVAVIITAIGYNPSANAGHQLGEQMFSHNKLDMPNGFFSRDASWVDGHYEFAKHVYLGNVYLNKSYKGYFRYNCLTEHGSHNAKVFYNACMAVYNSGG